MITTDPENVLLRVLKLSQKREGPKSKADKAKAADKSKRCVLFCTGSCMAICQCSSWTNSDAADADQQQMQQRVPLSAKGRMHRQQQQVSFLD